MEENKLIRLESSTLQKVGNVIAISNKLIAEKHFEQAEDLQYKQRKYDEANVFYLKAIELIPNYIEALNEIAQNLRLNIKNYQEAILYYSKVLEINPQYEYALFRRGLCKGALGDYLGQIEDLTKYIDNNKEQLDLYISRAIIRNKIKDYKGIIEDCSYVISLNNEESSAFQYRGVAKIELSHFIEGIADLEKAIEIEEKKSRLDPKYKPILFGALKHCALAKLSINDSDGALNIAEKFVAYSPNNPQPYKLRASIYEKIGNLEATKKDIAMFNKLNEEYNKKYGTSL